MVKLSIKQIKAAIKSVKNHPKITGKKKAELLKIAKELGITFDSPAPAIDEEARMKRVAALKAEMEELSK